MSKREKLLKRLASRPKDFTWAELASLMKALDYRLVPSSGSGRKFIHTVTQATMFLHEPHPAKVLKPYQVADAIDFLTKEGILS